MSTKTKFNQFDIVTTTEIIENHPIGTQGTILDVCIIIGIPEERYHIEVFEENPTDINTFFAKSEQIEKVDER